MRGAPGRGGARPLGVGDGRGRIYPRAGSSPMDFPPLRGAGPGGAMRPPREVERSRRDLAREGAVGGVHRRPVRNAPSQTACAGHGCCTILGVCRTHRHRPAVPDTVFGFAEQTPVSPASPRRKHRINLHPARVPRRRPMRRRDTSRSLPDAPCPIRLATNFIRSTPGGRTILPRLHRFAPRPDPAGARLRGHPPHPMIHHGGCRCS